MDSVDDRLAVLLAVPDRCPDVGFANEVELLVAAERSFTQRVAAERARTFALLGATMAVAMGLWLFVQGELFAGLSDAAGGSIVGFGLVAAVFLIWLGTAASGSLSSG